MSCASAWSTTRSAASSTTWEPQPPGTVVIAVSEWQPIAAYHAGPSTKMFWLSSQGIVLGPATGTGGLIDVQGPAGTDPRAGDRPLDPQLITAVVNIHNA